MKSTRGSWRIAAAALLMMGAASGCRTSMTAVRVPAEVAAPLLAMRTDLTAGRRVRFEAQDWVVFPASNAPSRMVYGRYDVLLERPGRLRVESEWEGHHAMLWYDAGHVVLHDVVRGVYLDTQAPDTLDAFLDALLDEGIVLPGHDFLYADPVAALVVPGTAMYHVGTVSLEGRACTHLLFQGDRLDWELWLTRDSPVVPVRVWLEDRRELPATSYMLEMGDWELSAVPLEAGDFIPRSLDARPVDTLAELLAHWEEAE